MYIVTLIWILTRVQRTLKELVKIVDAIKYYHDGHMAHDIVVVVRISNSKNIIIKNSIKSFRKTQNLVFDIKDYVVTELRIRKLFQMCPNQLFVQFICTL